MLKRVSEKQETEVTVCAILNVTYKSPLTNVLIPFRTNLAVI